MAASVRAHNRVRRKPRVERSPIIRVWAWLGSAATGSVGVCPAHYVAFSCPPGADRRAMGLLLVFKRLTARESLKAMEPPAVPVSSTRRIIGEEKANIKENFC